MNVSTKEKGLMAWELEVCVCVGGGGYQQQIILPNTPTLHTGQFRNHFPGRTGDTPQH